MIEIIPETHTLGRFDPHTLLIELNRTTKAELFAARRGEADSRGWEVYEHEVRHWRDLISTVWGRRYLDTLFAAYDAVLTTPPHRQNDAYPAVLRLFDTDRSILFPTYYKYVAPGAPRQSQTARWSMSFSTGVRIKPDGHPDELQPFCFVNFEAGGAPVARQPLTDGALLEVRALAAEVATIQPWGSMRPPGEGTTARLVRRSELIDQVYDPELTTYSVAAHVISYATGTPSIEAALSTGFKLADIAFNLDDRAFRSITPPAAFRLPPGQRLKGFRNTTNRGYALACVAFALRGQCSPEGPDRSELETALKRVGLPSLNVIYGNAKAALLSMPGRTARHDRLRLLRSRMIEAGAALHTIPDFDAPGTLIAMNADALSPLVGDADCEEFYVGIPLLSRDDTAFLYECHEAYRKVLRSALRAARGVDFEFTDFVY